MGIDEPFVVENGAAAFFPARFDDLELPDARKVGALRALVFGRSYGEVRAFARRVADRYGLEGFGDMSLDRVEEITGLPHDAAARAKARDFTEPFRLENEAVLPELEAEAAAAGFGITTGGRLHHLMGAHQDKGTAVRAVRTALQGAYGEPVTTIGLGDGPNDVPMLEVVDFAVLIPAPGRPLPDVPAPADRRHRVRVAPAQGPVGWAAALDGLVPEIRAG
jgi:mannosyl-3-phosphoglycerate phosphatase